MESMVGMIVLVACLTQHSSAQQPSPDRDRNLPDNWVDDIGTNEGDVERILNYLLHGAGKSQSYDRLAQFVDKFGNRFTGTDSLEHSIDYMVQELSAEGFENVHTEDVTVPRWVRGEEKAMLLQPRAVELYVMGLMDSVAGNITEYAIVVRDFNELQRRKDEVAGKIVVYNQEWTDYGAGYLYRTQGATRAADLGAVGVLIRSVTDFSIYSPHTGSQAWWSNVTRIPSGCISVEDAVMLYRMHLRNDPIVIHMEASHQTLEDRISRNVIAEITGSEKPEEVVMFGGHIDSWDVGVGAMDDGGGITITRQILTAMKQLNLRPKRTMRLVMWTAEEIGIIGGHAFWDAHKDDIDNMVFVMESDSGTFSPLGLQFHNMSGLAQAILEEILETYLHDIGADHTTIGGSGKADISDWINHGVPGVSLYNQNDLYFYYHHTEGDRMLVEDPGELDRCSSVFAVVAYVIANLDERLPLHGEYPTHTPYPSSALRVEQATLAVLLVACVTRVL